MIKRSDSKQTRNPEKACHQFVLTVRGADALTETIENALFEAGCDDALVHMCDGQLYLDFDREETSLHQAIVSAIRAVESCGQNLQVVAVSPPNADEIDQINSVLRTRNGGIKLLDELKRSSRK
jgi:hypothetical protein